MNLRKLVIGDIHGGLLSLKQLLTRCDYNPLTDMIIFLGDYVDGHKHSYEVIEYLIALKEVNPNIVFVKGNHDIWCEDWLVRGLKNPVWINNGGVSTMNSYINNSGLGDRRHVDFFNDMVNWYIDDDNNIFIHAGWDYMIEPFILAATQRYGYGGGTSARECHWNRNLFEGAMFAGLKEGGRVKSLEEFKEVFIGHTATVSYEVKSWYPEAKDPNQTEKFITVPINRLNLWNMDTGGGWYGKLTVMDVDTKEYWQSDLVTDIYGSSGRPRPEGKWKRKLL